MKKFGWTVWGIIGMIFSPIGLTFLLIGLFAANAGSFRFSGDPDLFRTVFIGMGSLFLLLGLGFLYSDLLRRHRLRQAFYGGNYVDAKILAIREVTNVRVNGRHPFVIECAWTDAYGKEHLYQSRYLYSAPGGEVVGRTVPVYVDRMNEDTGFVDVDAVL